MPRISVDEYAHRSSSFEGSLDDAYKKDNGIFYTDVRLAQSIIKYLGIDKSKIVIDPCCGTGSFLFSAVLAGCTRVYGAELDGEAVKLCRELTGLNSIEKVDTLGKSGKAVLASLGLAEKADYVIGNPPYCPMDKNIVIDTSDDRFLKSVKASGSNLFVAALYRSFELAKDDGIISYIIPKNFLHVKSYSPLRRDILRNKSILSIIDIGAYFPCVRGEQIILTLRNRADPNNLIQIKKLSGSNFEDCCSVEQKLYRDEILLFKSSEEYSIYRKLEDSYEKLSDLCTGYIGRGKSTASGAITGKSIRKFGFKDRDVPGTGNQVFIQNIYSAESGIIASFAGSEWDAGQTVTVFTDGDERLCRYIVGILHSRLCNFYLLKFCYNSSKLTMHTDAKYLSRIPLVRNGGASFDQVVALVKSLETKKYMSDVWFEALESLNRLVYEVYGMNETEAAYIDAEMLSLQSKRWRNDK